jgi:GMP synthase (glutamine-hydrolysing)
VTDARSATDPLNEPALIDRPTLLVLQLDESGPVGRLGEWLVDAGADLVIWRVFEGAPRPAIDTRGLVVLGGMAGVHESDQHPWLTEVHTELSDALREDLPVLALGLGAQALALAAGGEVGEGDEGPEYGAQLVAKRQTAATDPLLREVPITPDVIQWHSDVVTRMPKGAILLASSPYYEAQAFRIGTVAWGFQFHIETTPAIVQEWARIDSAALEGYDVPRMLARSEAAHDDIAETWAPVAANFVEVARDPASVSKPPRTVIASGSPIMDPAEIRAALAAEANAARSHPAVLPLPTFRPTD